ncbi:hypothetical protein U1Q18_045754 [Sarracenia purpurea var. burkii]
MQNQDAQNPDVELNGVSGPQYFKDKSKKWLKFVAQAKASGRTTEDCLKVGEAAGAAVLQNYNDILRSCNALDYHDLISSPVIFLKSIFSFNGADVSGFDSFRKDFPNHKEVRLTKNCRSTRCIVEAASSFKQNNLKSCQLKNVLTDNSCGSKITVKECCNEDAQCAFVVDKILEITSKGSSSKCT